MNRALLMTAIAGTAFIAVYLSTAGSSGDLSADVGSSSAALPAAGGASPAKPGELNAGLDGGPNIQIITRAQAAAMGIVVPPPPSRPPSAAEQAESNRGPTAVKALRSGLAPGTYEETDVVDLSPYADTIPPPPDEPGEAPVPTDCDADFDRSGTSDSADLLGYIDRWFALDPQQTERMDFNDTGELDNEDLTRFINVWVSGC